MNEYLWNGYILCIFKEYISLDIFHDIVTVSILFASQSFTFCFRIIIVYIFFINYHFYDCVIIYCYLDKL